ncbi:hypothetical protein [Desulfobacula sp.]|uniref:hypothetical protein n=1 Tax=Desulfobacula sp. TaxID=2593537 RepID=UPI001ED2F94C|nr:hypothetical protein [Desulfobacula sp.]
MGIDFFNRLEKILVYKEGVLRAVHKPLYLLYCIAAVQRDEPRLQEYRTIAPILEKALRLFGPRTDKVHPEYPFWRLQNDKLTEVVADGPLETRSGSNDPKKVYYYHKMHVVVFSKLTTNYLLAT